MSTAFPPPRHEVAAVLGRLDGTTTFRNVDRFPEVRLERGVRVVRIDAALSFVNATQVKRLLRAHAAELTEAPRALVLDAAVRPTTDFAARIRLSSVSVMSPSPL